MRNLLIALTFFAAFSNCTLLGINRQSKIPIFKIDLDQDPAQRFISSATYFKPQLEKSFKDFLGKVPSFVQTGFWAVSPIIKYFQPEKAAEIGGMCTKFNREFY